MDDLIERMAREIERAFAADPICGGRFASGTGEAAASAAFAEVEPLLPKWQPIETAPRDGMWVLIWDADSEHGLGRYCEIYALADDDPWSGATHWMPLPAPPTTKEDSCGRQ